jgi:hypothetical protein
MKDMFINIPELIGQPISTLNQWISDNQLSTSKFPITEVEPRNADEIALIGKIAELNPNLQNTSYETSNKDQLTFTVTVIKDKDINLNDILGKEILPSYCTTYNLCTRIGTATSGKVISVAIGGTTYTTAPTTAPKLSAIKNSGGIQYTLEGSALTP